MDAEALLVRRAQQGDDEAFKLLFGRYTDELRARVHQRLSPLLRRKVSGADILQDAFLVAFERIDDFENRGDGSFGHWLGQIVENRARQVIERFAGTAKRDPRREVSRDARPDTCQFVGRVTSPSEAAMAGELRKAAARALRELPEGYREVLRLLQEQDLSFPEAAAHLDRTVAATRKLYSRALARYSQLLQAYDGGTR